MAELTRKLMRQVQALAEAKHRRSMGLFAAEGTKCVTDTAGAFECVALYATAEWLEQNPDAPARMAAHEVVVCGKGDLRQMSTLMATPPVIAVYRLPAMSEFSPERVGGELMLAVDRVQDPGNFGTMVRTADWFGIRTVLASTDTVDIFNPKCVQATMGAIARVKVVYGDLAAMLGALHGPIFGTFLDGENIYHSKLENRGVVVMGNEGRGISPEVEACVTHRLLIPRYPTSGAASDGSESLNVASATAIILAHIRSLG